jgi:hypothetical protein
MIKILLLHSVRLQDKGPVDCQMKPYQGWLTMASLHKVKTGPFSLSFVFEPAPAMNNDQ